MPSSGQSQFSFTYTSSIYPKLSERVLLSNLRSDSFLVGSVMQDSTGGTLPLENFFGVVEVGLLDRQNLQPGSLIQSYYDFISLISVAIYSPEKVILLPSFTLPLSAYPNMYPAALFRGGIQVKDSLKKIYRYHYYP